jgi:hypothetical protein
MAEADTIDGARPAKSGFVSFRLALPDPGLVDAGASDPRIYSDPLAELVGFRRSAISLGMVP